MKGFGIFTALYFIVMVVLVVWAISFLLGKLNDVEAEVDAMIGSEVVYKSDTLLITNYNLFNNSYGLDNGTEVSAKLLDDLEVIIKEEIK